MLRIIDSTRIKLQPFVSEMLSTLNKLSTNITKTLNTPQILFIFEAYDGFEYIIDSNVKFYVRQLEEQILRLLRKTRLINSLFSISSLNSFVFIATKTSTIINYDEYFFEKIFNRCSEDNLNNNDKFQLAHNEHISFSNFILPYINSLINSKDPNGKCNELAKADIFFKKFLSFKELIFKQTYTGISSEKVKNLQQILDSFHSTLDIDNRFSEARCSKVVASAINFYKENLPAYYTRETHELKLMLTLQHFTMQNRGPALNKYIKNIKKDCTLFWTNGHKMCEELSLTGNQCINKVHLLPHDDYCDQQVETMPDGESNQPLETKAHLSKAKIISACDCGRRQGTRDDPFTVKAANYDFYLKMKYKCHTCRSITRFKFYYYDSKIEIDYVNSSQNMASKNENRDSPLIMKTSNDAVLSSSEFYDGDKNDNSEEIQPNDLLSIENLSNYNSLNNDDNDNYFCDEMKNDIRKNDDSKSDENQPSDGSNEKSEQSKNESSSTQSYEDYLEKNFLSDEENFLGELNGSNSPTSPKDIIDVKTLPPMIHTMCIDNLPARFSSWSLVYFGSSSIYSHNHGIQDQQGFVKGSHYLLPWNVTVLLQHLKRPLWEGKRPPGIKHKKQVKGNFLRNE